MINYNLLKPKPSVHQFQNSKKIAPFAKIASKNCPEEKKLVLRYYFLVLLTFAFFNKILKIHKFNLKLVALLITFHSRLISLEF